MATCSAQELIDASNCLACLSIHQLQLVRVMLLCRILQQSNPLATCDPQSLLDSAQCLNCLTPQQLLLVSTQLTCEILNAGGVGGNPCIVCSQSSNPAADPGCDCALAYRRDNGAFWTWNDALGQWDQLLG